MTAASAFLIFFIVVAVLIVGAVVVSRLGSGMPRDQKAELREARALIKRIQRLAIQHSDIYPELSLLIRSEIDESEMKELQ